MILLLDIGNSRLKAALAHEGRIGEVSALSHDGDPAAAVALLPAATPRAIAVANVTGATHELRLMEALQARYGRAPRIARTQAQCAGLQVAYAQPERLGVDRWLMMLALWCETGAAFGVAGAGTALTYDAVDAQGNHLGGFIAAGLATHLQATLGATRFDTRMLDARYDDGFGRDTEA
ncbi:MAG TPA: type III pantothenate kinase, partial [Solimonas sp.]|nr:type III pantothenate kinase [Solimonas sp.]